MTRIDPITPWTRHIRQSITTPLALAEVLEVDREMLEQVHARFPLRVSTYYLDLIRRVGAQIANQVVPDARELEETGLEDPLGEEGDSPVPGISHRYPDRVLFYVNHLCPVYCRFCTRKRKVSDPHSVSQAQIEQGIDYIRAHPEVRDVIVSGGDPLMLLDDRLDHILGGLRAIPHVEIIRIGSRVPVALPQRITPELARVLQRHHPLYINVHFNHPGEITEESSRACAVLADAGIPLGNQSVLLKGVNDDPEVMKELVQKLLAIRVKPYLIYLMDLVQGAEHFRTSVQDGLDIIQALRGFTSGMAVPTLVIDAPGGGGKIPITPDAVVTFDDEEIVIRNYEGELYRYPSHPADQPVQTANDLSA